MYTFLRRATASVLVAGGLVLTSTGVVRVDDHVTPAVLMLVLAGGAVLLYRRPRRRSALDELLVVHEPAFVGGPVPTQRTPLQPRCVVPTPHPSPEAVVPIGGHVVGALSPWHAARASGLARGGLRHCVVSRGGLPHQRRATGGS